MKHSALAIAAILCTALTACGGNGSPSGLGGGGGGASLPGTYTATRWVTTGGSGQTDQIVAGSTLTITLNANGTTSGHLHLVSSGSNPAVDADMAGIWSQLGGVVGFSQNADTFVRNMQFSVVANGPKWALDGDQVFSGSTRVQITLTQQ